MSRAFFLSVILFFSVANQGFAQVKVYPAITPASSPEAVGFSSERLKRIDTMLQGYVDRQRVNGVVGLLIRDGKIVYHKSFGYDDIDAKTPMKKDAIFRIASQTKAITSVAAMILYEEGKFNLDDPISNYIPEFKNPKVLDKFNMEDTTWTTVPAEKISFDAAKRKNIYLIFKESVNNAIKYSQCTRLHIGFEKESNRLLMQVKDNGKGFDINNGRSGNGLKSMKERALVIGAEFKIESGSGKGTSVIAAIPLN